MNPGRARDGEGNYVREDPVERFWRFVDRTGECWVWTGHRNRGGYGTFWDGRRHVLAHRFSYETHLGPVPHGHELDHYVCDNPPCVNPVHLRPSTGVANRARRTAGASVVNAGKTTCPRGHAYTARDSRGTRICHPCIAIRSRERRARLRAKPKEATADAA